MPGSIAAQWAQIRAAAPQAAATIQRYLQRLAAFLAPASVDAAENALRQFARWMITDAGLEAIAAVRRDDIEDYKVWLAAQPRAGGQAITVETHRQRIRTVRAFFERIVGHPAYNTDTLCADLRRFVFLLGASDGEELFGEPTS